MTQHISREASARLEVRRLSFFSFFLCIFPFASALLKLLLLLTCHRRLGSTVSHSFLPFFQSEPHPNNVQIIPLSHARSPSPRADYAIVVSPNSIFMAHVHI